MFCLQIQMILGSSAEDYFLVRLTDKALALPQSRCITNFLFSLSHGKFSSLSSWVNFSIRKCKATKEPNQHFKSIPLVQGRISPDNAVLKRCSPVCPSNSSHYHDSTIFLGYFFQHFTLNSVRKLI